MSTLSQRIQHARLSAGLTRAEVGNQLNVSTQTVRTWELEEGHPEAAAPKRHRLDALSSLLQVTPEYLLTGNDARLNAEKYVFIARYSPASKERKVPHYDPVKALNHDDSFAYRIDMLERLGITAAHCRVVETTDPSMHIGDQLLVDLTQAKLVAGKVYVIDTKKHGLLARYLYPCEGDMIALRSDKDSTPDILPRNQITIVGRVVYASGAL